MRIEELPVPPRPSWFRRLLAVSAAHVATPFLAAWGRARERYLLAHGRPLDERETQWAGLAGVKNPSEIRILLEAPVAVPLPTGLMNLLEEAGLPVFFPAGMCVGRGVAVDPDYAHPEILTHEFRHAAQYQALGGIRAFMHRYIHECLCQGYRQAPLEMDARRTAALLPRTA